MSFLKILSRPTTTKYFFLVLSLALIILFSLPPIISSAHFPIISDAWAATYYVDATNGNDSSSGLSEATPWKTIAKVNASNFNQEGEILFPPTLLRMDPEDQPKNMNVGLAAFAKN